MYQSVVQIYFKFVFTVNERYKLGVIFQNQSGYIVVRATSVPLKIPFYDIITLKWASFWTIKKIRTY